MGPSSPAGSRSDRRPPPGPSASTHRLSEAWGWPPAVAGQMGTPVCQDTVTSRLAERIWLCDLGPSSLTGRGEAEPGARAGGSSSVARSVRPGPPAWCACARQAAYLRPRARGAWGLCSLHRPACRSARGAVCSGSPTPSAAPNARHGAWQPSSPGCGPGPRGRRHCTLHPAPGIYGRQYTGSRGQDQDTGGWGVLRSWSQKAEGPRSGTSHVLRGPGSGVTKTPPREARLHSGPELCSLLHRSHSAQRGGGEAAQSPHHPGRPRPSPCFVSRVSGMERGPGPEDRPLLPRPGERTGQSWNVREVTLSRVEAGGPSRCGAREEGAIWWPGAELQGAPLAGPALTSPACVGRTGWGPEVPSAPSQNIQEHPAAPVAGAPEEGD